MFSRTKLLYTLHRPNCRSISDKGFDSLLSLLKPPRERFEIQKPTALEKGASRFYELGRNTLNYACVGGIGPADFSKVKDLQPDFRGLEIDILRCPELLAYHIMELFPDVRIEKRRLKVIQLCSQMDNKNNAERQCLNAANLIMTQLVRERSFALYSGDKNVRKPLSYYLDHEFNQPSYGRSPSDASIASRLHATITNTNGLTRITNLSTNDVGVIYTDDVRDIDTLKEFIFDTILTGDGMKKKE